VCVEIAIRDFPTGLKASSGRQVASGIENRGHER
jgi:hypothetical protein